MSASSIITLGRPDADVGMGQAGERVLGTRKSGPSGIESVLEYNGLYMNVREWVDTYLVTNIAGIDDADVLDSRENNPTDDGETPFLARYGGRTVVLAGKIQTKTLWKLRDMQSALRRAFSDISTERPLIFRTTSQDTDLMLYCKKSGKIEMGEEQTTQNCFERSFQITLRASNPRFVGYKENSGRQKWGYMESFSGSSPMLSVNEITNPSGKNGTVGNAVVFSGYSFMTASGVAAPDPIAGSGTAVKIAGSVPANTAGSTYVGYGTTLITPAGTPWIGNVTTYSLYLRYLWTILSNNATIGGVLLRWVNSVSGTSADQYFDAYNSPAGVANVVKEVRADAGKVPLLSDGTTPNAVQLIVFFTQPGGVTTAQQYELYVTDATFCLNDNGAARPFDGDNKGSYWSGTPYASRSVRSQQYANRWQNAAMLADSPYQTWGTYGTADLSFDGKGSAIVKPPAGGTPYFYFGNYQNMMCYPNDTWSFRWKMTPKVSGYYYTDIRAGGNYKIPNELGSLAGSGYLLFMEAGKTYTFTVENWKIPTGFPPDAFSYYIGGLKASNNAVSGLDQGQDITFTECIAIKHRVTPGLMSAPYDFTLPTATGLSTDWNQGYLPASVHLLDGRLYFDQVTNEASLIRKSRDSGVKDRTLTLKFRTPPSIVVNSVNNGIISRWTNGKNYLLAQIFSSGNNSIQIGVSKFTNGAYGQFASSFSGGITVAPNTDYIVVFTVNGNSLTLKMTDAFGNVLASTTGTITDPADIAAFGAGVIGDDGLSANMANTNSRLTGLDDFTVEPLTVGPTVSHQVVNAGDYSAQPIIRIYGGASLDLSVPANAGKIAMTLTNEANGEVLAIRCKEGTFTAIAKDRYLEIDIAKKTMKEYVTSTGALVGNGFDRLDPGSDWLTLKPGNNNLTTRYFMTSGQPQVDVRWRRTHM